MTTPGPVDYPIPEDMAFQRRSWIVERAAWIAMGAVALAAGFGLLSHGPLSRTTATAQDARLAVSYERLERREASSRLVVRTVARNPADETVIRLGPRFLDTYEIRAITPAPLRASSGAEGFTATFAASARGEAEIYITGRAKRFGPVAFPVAVPGGDAVEVSQFVFP